MIRIEALQLDPVSVRDLLHTLHMGATGVCGRVGLGADIAEPAVVPGDEVGGDIVAEYIEIPKDQGRFVARSGQCSQSDFGKLAVDDEIEELGVEFINLKYQSIRLPSVQSGQRVAIDALANPTGLLAVTHDSPPLFDP